MNIVVVESPTKAKTIGKYLGPDYTVLASFGHVRDLPPKTGSVLPEKDFQMIWEINKPSQKHMENIIRAVQSSENLILATDPDREGEAIAWHVFDILKERNLLKKIKVTRVAFNAITKQSVLHAMKNARDINSALVNAYLARRALDYLVGFNLSPVLWRKLPGARSAGRVQSVALRLICNRESQIECFIPEEYWLLSVLLETPRGESFKVRLVDIDGQHITKTSIRNREEAYKIASFLEKATYVVTKIEKKIVKRNPGPAFTTSTLQQAASSRLGFSATHTMRIAQKLYEGINLDGETIGLITYMRTDSVQISSEALDAARRSIVTCFSDRYLPEKPRIYSTKAKNAQEAHEAIRPNDFGCLPITVKKFLDSDQFRLYELIWKRSIASQMASAEFERTTVDIKAVYGNQTANLRAVGSYPHFDGFLAAWEENNDQEKVPDEEKLLPYIKNNEQLSAKKTDASQHFTEPLPRYSEASLIKKLEELGIGRPSTYAVILSTLCDRGYVILDKRRLLPQSTGRIVIAFLENFFSRYVEYDFTADLEEELDEISSGKLDWQDVLRKFWKDFIEKIDGTKELRISNVIDTLNNTLHSLIFPPRENDDDNRMCPACKNNQLSLKLSKYGAFVGCTNYPECHYTRQLTSEKQATSDVLEQNEPKSLGIDPLTNESITLRSGRFGFYVQCGEGKNSKRCSLPKNWSKDDMDYTKAMSLLSLPREVGVHPETGKSILAGTGRYGLYLNHDGNYVKLESIEQVLTINLDQAVSHITEKLKDKKSPRKRSKGLEVGVHPDGGVITLHSGRYGPYISWGKINASLPKSENLEQITLQDSLGILESKMENNKKKRKKS